MYDINTKNVKKGKKFYLIFFLAGLLFFLIIGGIIVSGLLKKAKLDATTMSTAVDVNTYTSDEGNTLYSPSYYYEVGGKEYKCDSDSSSSIHPGEGSKKVYYNSRKPEECMTEYSSNSNKILVVVLLLPIVFMAMGIFIPQR